MPANPVLMPQTAYDAYLRWRPWLRDVALEHLRTEPHVAEGRHGLNAEAATSGMAQPLLFDGLATMIRPMLRQRGVDASSWPTDKVLAAVPPEPRSGMVAMVTREYMAVLNLVLSGEKAFLFSPNLSERLADTEMNVPVELFALPFRSCMFVYDNDTARDALHAISGSVAPRRGAVTVFLTLTAGAGGEEYLALYANHIDGNEAIAATMRSLRLDNAKTVEDALRTVHDNPQTGNGDATLLGDEVFFGPGLRFYRMVMNSVLYLSSADPDVSAEGPNRLSDELMALPPKKRRYAEHLLKKASPAPFVHVGEKMPSLPPVPTDGTGRKVDARFKVRAHWRSQAYGEGRQLRKTILIEEHWKGPDAAEIVSRPYLVG